jgi:glycosyltransferase involved in cell wall biosynthesis
VLVPPKNSKALTDAIERVLTDNAFYNDLVAKYTKLDEELAIETIIERLMNDYKTL